MKKQIFIKFQVNDIVTKGRHWFWATHSEEDTQQNTQSSRYPLLPPTVEATVVSACVLMAEDTKFNWIKGYVTLLMKLCQTVVVYVKLFDLEVVIPMMSYVCLM